MNNWVRRKQANHHRINSLRKGDSQLGVSILLAFAILVLSLASLLLISNPLVSNQAVSPTSAAQELLTLDSQRDVPHRGDYPIRSSDAPITRQSIASQSIIWAHESSVPFQGDINRLSPDIRRIIQRGTLVVALPSDDAFPFFYTHPTRHALTGIDVKIARSLAAYLGVDVQFDRSSPTFDAVINTVFDQDVDLAIAKISLTLDRARQIRYSQPYASFRPGLLFNRLELSHVMDESNYPDSNPYQSPIDTMQRLGSAAHLGVIQASSYINFTRSMFPEAEITEYADWESLIDAVVHGRVLAGCRDELAIKHEILVRPDANIQMQSIVIDNWIDEIAVALPWESEILNKFVDYYLSATDLYFTADQLLTQFMRDANFEAQSLITPNVLKTR